MASKQSKNNNQTLPPTQSFATQPLPTNQQNNSNQNKNVSNNQNELTTTSTIDIDLSENVAQPTATNDSDTVARRVNNNDTNNFQPERVNFVQGSTLVAENADLYPITVLDHLDINERYKKSPEQLIREREGEKTWDMR